jgi:hypothetical protein
MPAGVFFACRTAREAKKAFAAAKAPIIPGPGPVNNPLDCENTHCHTHVALLASGEFESPIPRVSDFQTSVRIIKPKRKITRDFPDTARISQNATVRPGTLAMRNRPTARQFHIPIAESANIYENNNIR